MFFNTNTLTMNVGSRNWLEAGDMRVIPEFFEQSTLYTAPRYDLPVPSREYENSWLTKRLNEAYRDDELEPEEREFLDLTREHFSRLDDM